MTASNYVALSVVIVAIAGVILLTSLYLFSLFGIIDSKEVQYSEANTQQAYSQLKGIESDISIFLK